MRKRLRILDDRRVEDVHAGRVDVPVDEACFLASAVGAPLKNLRGNGKHIVAALESELAQRIRLERHVVVEQQRPVVARPSKAALDGRIEAARCIGVDELQRRPSFQNRAIARFRGAVGHDDDLLRLGDVAQGRVQALERLCKQFRGVAIRNDD